MGLVRDVGAFGCDLFDWCCAVVTDIGEEASAMVGCHEQPAEAEEKVNHG